MISYVISFLLVYSCAYKSTRKAPYPILTTERISGSKMFTSSFFRSVPLIVNFCLTYVDVGGLET